MRKLAPKRLIRVAGWLLLVWVLVAGFGRFSGVYFTHKKGVAAIKAVHAGKVLSQDERDSIGDKVKQDHNWWHSTKAAEENIAKHKTYLKALGADAKDEYQASSAISFAFPDVLVFMLLGMALYKNGFLTLQQPTSVYVKTAVIGYLIFLAVGCSRSHRVVAQWLRNCADYGVAIHPV